MGVCCGKLNQLHPDETVNFEILKYNDRSKYIIQCDKHYRIIYVNQNACLLLGYEYKSLISSYIWKLLTEHDIPNYKDLIKSGMNGMTTNIIQLIRKDGTHRNVLYSVTFHNSIYTIQCIDLRVIINPHIPYSFQNYMYSNHSTQCITQTNTDVVCIRLGLIHMEHISHTDLLSYLQSIRFLLMKDIIAEHKRYVYLSLPESFHMYILIHTDFVKNYRKYASLSYTIAMDAIRKINDFLSLKLTALRISATITIGSLNYGLLNNQYFHICGEVKDEADTLFQYVDKDSVILSESLHELILEENTHTQLEVDVNELTKMSPFIRCKVNMEMAEYENLSANKVLMRFLNIG